MAYHVIMNSSWHQEAILALYDEYSSICSERKLELLPPLMVIVPPASYWARWDPLRRVIEINEALIKDHSWGVVIDVLRHEMAHQYVDEQLKEYDTSHGASFHCACDLLGVPQWARAATGPLPSCHELNWEKHQFASDPSLARLMRKVEKLLSLAQSSQEHEASLAMRRVQEILARYNLERMTEHRQAVLVHKYISHGKRRISGTDSRILSLLTSFFYVQVIFIYGWDLKRQDTVKAFEIIGTRENVLMAEYVYNFLRRTVDCLWQDYKKHTKVSGRRDKNSYIYGVLSGLEAKLAKQKRETRQEFIKQRPGAQASSIHPDVIDSQLSVVDRECSQYIKQRYPRIHYQTSATTRVNGSIYAQGEQDGHKINIHKPLSEKRSSELALNAASLK